MESKKGKLRKSILRIGIFGLLASAIFGSGAGKDNPKKSRKGLVFGLVSTAVGIAFMVLKTRNDSKNKTNVEPKKEIEEKNDIEHTDNEQLSNGEVTHNHSEVNNNTDSTTNSINQPAQPIETSVDAQLQNQSKVADNFNSSLYEGQAYTDSTQDAIERLSAVQPDSYINEIVSRATQELDEDAEIEEPEYKTPEIEESIYQAPEIEEPEYDVPEIEEVKYEEPIFEEPKYEEPKYEEAKYEEPKYEVPEYEAPKYEVPEYEEPKYETPMYEEPKYEEPMYEAPKYEEPKYEAPKYEEPKYEEPKYEEPRYEAPKYEAPKYEEPKYEEPKYETPMYEEPKYEEPKYEEPKYEVPEYEEPEYEEPEYEEPEYEEPEYEEPEFDEPEFEEPSFVEEKVPDDSMEEMVTVGNDVVGYIDIPKEHNMLNKTKSKGDPNLLQYCSKMVDWIISISVFNSADRDSLVKKMRNSMRNPIITEGKGDMDSIHIIDQHDEEYWEVIFTAVGSKIYYLSVETYNPEVEYLIPKIIGSYRIQ